MPEDNIEIINVFCPLTSLMPDNNDINLRNYVQRPFNPISILVQPLYEKIANFKESNFNTGEYAFRFIMSRKFLIDVSNITKDDVSVVLPISNVIREKYINKDVLEAIKICFDDLVPSGSMEISEKHGVVSIGLDFQKEYLALMDNILIPSGYLLDKELHTVACYYVIIKLNNFPIGWKFNIHQYLMNRVKEPLHSLRDHINSNINKESDVKESISTTESVNGNETVIEVFLPITSEINLLNNASGYSPSNILSLKHAGMVFNRNPFMPRSLISVVARGLLSNISTYSKENFEPGKYIFRLLVDRSIFNTGYGSSGTTIDKEFEAAINTVFSNVKMLDYKYGREYTKDTIASYKRLIVNQFLTNNDNVEVWFFDAYVSIGSIEDLNNWKRTLTNYVNSENMTRPIERNMPFTNFHPTEANKVSSNISVKEFQLFLEGLNSGLDQSFGLSAEQLTMVMDKFNMVANNFLPSPSIMYNTYSTMRNNEYVTLTEFKQFVEGFLCDKDLSIGLNKSDWDILRKKAIKIIPFDYQVPGLPGVF